MQNLKLPPSTHNSIDEIGALEKFCSVDIRSILHGGTESFVRFVTGIGKAICGEGSFRKIMVATQGRESWSVYPHFDLIETQLQSIFAFLRNFGVTHPVFAAIVLHNSIVNIHPFVDGNGRVARLLYNWLIRCKFPEAFYLPLYEIATLSEMGFVIRLRQAQYHNNWGPLIRLYGHVVGSFAHT